MSVKEIKSKLSPSAKKIIKKNKIIFSVQGCTKHKPYSQKKFLIFSEGYDFLQNWFVARTFVQKKYKLDLQELELILQLYPLKMFTYEDHKFMPKNYRVSKIQQLLRRDLIVVVQEGKRIDTRLYALSSRANSAVRMLYKLLSGERKFPERYDLNPMSRPEASTYDKKKFAVMKVLNTTSREHLKPLYEK